MFQGWIWHRDFDNSRGIGFWSFGRNVYCFICGRVSADSLQTFFLSYPKTEFVQWHIIWAAPWSRNCREMEVEQTPSLTPWRRSFHIYERYYMGLGKHQSCSERKMVSFLVIFPTRNKNTCYRIFFFFIPGTGIF